MPESGPCNRPGCGAHKENVLGLCGVCGRFPAPTTKKAREMAYGKGRRLRLLETYAKNGLIK